MPQTPWHLEMTLQILLNTQAQKHLLATPGMHQGSDLKKKKMLITEFSVATRSPSTEDRVLGKCP